MKKNAKKIVALVLIAVFVLSGMMSKHVIHRFKTDAIQLLKFNYSFADFTDKLSSDTNNLRYHDALIDLESLILKTSGKTVIQKGDSTVIRLENGYLYSPFSKTPDESLDSYCENVTKLYRATKENGAEFLYVMEPSKGITKSLPFEYENSLKETCDDFLKKLNKSSIPVLDLVSEMNSDCISEEDMFFATDHHWKPEYGFWAFGKMCRELNNRYGFEYDKSLTDISNYDIKNYENWFLGSQGKKTGRLFTPLGADDISLITPKFETQLTEEQPNKDEYREGTFSETVLFMDNINTKDYYNLNPYAVYSGGDFRLQIIKNQLSANNTKVLIIRDSYSCATVPFLSLAAKEVHVVDVRDGDYYVGDRINVYNYIDEIKPDFVIVAYNVAAIGDESSGFNFG